MDTLSRTFLALADPTRRAMLGALLDGPRTVNELVAGHALSQPAISKHLKVLEVARLVSRSRVARTRPCALDPDGLREAARWIDVHRARWEDAFSRMDGLIADLETGGLNERD